MSRICHKAYSIVEKIAVCPRPGYVLTSLCVTNPAPPPPIFPVQQRWFRLRKFLVRGFWSAVCLTVAVVLWLLWYVSNHGFARKWRYVLVQEIAKSGLPVTIERLTLNPLRGLAAKNVRVMDARVHGRTLAVIDEIVLDIDYSHLVHHEPFINAIDLCDASVSLPLKPGEPDCERIDVTGLKARILLPPHRIDVAQAEADIHGLHVTASGRLMNPEGFMARREQPAQTQSPGFDLYQAIKALDRLKFTGGKPVLDLHFEGDLEQPAKLFAKATFRSNKFTARGKYTVNSVTIGAVYSDGLIRLEQCSLGDACGVLDGSGVFDLTTGEGAFHVRSNVNLPEFARIAGAAQILDNVGFDSPPLLELDGSVDWRTGQPFRGKLLGHIVTNRFRVGSNAFQGGACDFSWDGQRWYIRDARIQHQSGELNISAVRTPEDFRFSLDSAMSPKLFLPLLPPDAREKLSAIQFQSAPRFHVEGQGPSLSADSLDIHGHLSLGATHYRGIGIDSVTLNFGLKDGVLAIRDLRIQRPEGTGAGALTYDLKTDRLQLDHVRTTLVPTDVASTFDRDLSRNLAPYRFKRRPDLLLDGSIDCRKGHMENNRLKIEVDGAAGMDYTLIHRNLSVSKVTANLSIVGEHLKISSLEGSVLGGKVRADMDFNLRKSKGDYSVALRMENIDFPSLTKLYLDYDASKGRLTGSFDFTGKHDLAREIKGKGRLVVENGNVFAIPLFGPLSGVIANVGYENAHKGTCTFTLRDGVVATDDLNVSSKLFSMLGRGKIYVLDDKIDFSVRLAAEGAAGVLFSPFGKLLEYTADNTLSNPNWHPKRLPKALFAPRQEPSPPPVAAPEQPRSSSRGR